MITSLYTIQDVVSGVFLAPFLAANNNVAKRMCSDLLSTGTSTLKANSADYNLTKTGTFDDSLGTVTPQTIPTFVCNLQTLIRTSDHDPHP